MYRYFYLAFYSTWYLYVVAIKLSGTFQPYLQASLQNVHLYLGGFTFSNACSVFVFQDYDLCVSCYEKDQHPHRMEKLGFDLDGGSPERGQNTPEVRRQSLERCIKSLVHSCQCRNANCGLQSCLKMRRIVSHTKSCRKKGNGGCPICKQLLALCFYHAKLCKEDKCMVPFCSSIKARLAHQQMQAQVQQKALLQRRIAQMRSVSGGAMAASVQAAAQPQPGAPPPSQPPGQMATAAVPPVPSPAGPGLPDGGKQTPGGPSPNVLMAVQQVSCCPRLCRRGQGGPRTSCPLALGLSVLPRFSVNV